MRVVNVRSERYTHYIGRPCALSNPFRLSAYNDRETVITMYEEYIRAEPEKLKLIANLPEDAVLGCFCHPLSCHGDIIVKIWKELHETL